MLSLKKYSPSVSDGEAAEVRDQLRALAEIVIEKMIEDRKKERRAKLEKDHVQNHSIQD